MTQFALRRAVAALAVSALLILPAAAVSLIEDFSSDPFGNWVYGVGSNVSNQFVYSASAAPAWTGDAIGQLEVHLDSNLPTVRLQRPLGVTLTDTDSFTLKTRFSFTPTYASPNNSMQIAFGLVNQATIGSDRTMTPSTSGDTYNTLEFNYFPSVTGWGGPTLTPAVFGTQKLSWAFANFKTSFETTPSIPSSTLLEVIFDYVGGTRTLSLTVNQVAPNGFVTLVQSTIPMELGPTNAFNNYDTNFSYVVDALAIMAYQDGWNQSLSDPSLQADLQFQRFEFVTPIPEPKTTFFLGGFAALMVLAKACHRRTLA